MTHRNNIKPDSLQNKMGGGGTIGVVTGVQCGQVTGPGSIAGRSNISLFLKAAGVNPRPIQAIIQCVQRAVFHRSTASSALR